MITVRPLASFLTVTFFSKEARSCAAAKVASNKAKIRVCRIRRFIEPPTGWTDKQSKSLKLRGESDIVKLVPEHSDPVICRKELENIGAQATWMLDTRTKTSHGRATSSNMMHKHRTSKFGEPK